MKANRKSVNTAISQESAIYYGFRVVQRVLLLCAAAFTAIAWMQMIAFSEAINTAGISFSVVENQTVIDNLSQSVARSQDNSDAIKGLAVIFSVAAITSSAALMMFRRVLDFEKRVVVDGMVIGAFCLVFAVYSMSIFSRIIGTL